jgi:hypothetical protein
MNKFDEMRGAVAEAKQTLAAADSVAGEMASLLVGRLRCATVRSWDLKRLKKELRDFNIHTGTWKS